MKIQENVALSAYTTFKIGGPARFFCIIEKEADIPEAVAFAKEKGVPFMAIGGGSNLLFADSGFPGLVIHIAIKGILEKGNMIVANAGEDWDGFVRHTVENGFHGLENLSFIPGTVGAAPVQNVGAYGVDASSLIESVRAYDVQSSRFVDLSNAECGFAYRDSMFKHAKGRYIVASVTFKLSKDAPVNIEYRDLANHFAGKPLPTVSEVRDAVITIRTAKLPDWRSWGTAGSFFKNPIITADTFVELKKRYPELPGYPEPDGRVKVSLAWILDKLCDARGLCMGNACTYERQALVIVAMPGASAVEVVALADELMKRVKGKTGIDIEGEVEWVVA